MYESFDAPLQHQFYLASNQGADYDLSKILMEH